MNPQAEKTQPADDQQPEQQPERPAVLATTTIHTASDIAIALTLADGTAGSVGVMPPALADAIAVTIFSHLSENHDRPAPEENAGEDVVVPKVASVDVPLAIDLDDFSRWYDARDAELNPSDEPTETATPDPKAHPQLVAEYVQHLLNR